jgi:hypothetical protein
MMRALAWGLVVALYLRFGLEPTGWLFYELSHLTGIDWMYWGYSAFRGGGFAFGLWPYQLAVCIAAGALVAALLYWRSSRRGDA